ncbi:hypothetical protein T4D_10187 [Trichinella pseudospiralis]|uniref:Uncharacterized protein n=1 Tax=Trichinella pseudospiralis TaxID=6337 RepID=A0A0V1G424_TRIPS|nr:hypothetical protein T4D_10187 [Trichinella pseudospiralis]
MHSSKKEVTKKVHTRFVAKKLVIHFLGHKNSKCRNLALRSSLPTLGFCRLTTSEIQKKSELMNTELSGLQLERSTPKQSDFHR